MSLALATQRRLTSAFIATKPTSIVLTPKADQITPGGGRKRIEGPARDAQTVLLSEPRDSGQRQPVRAGDGIQRDIDYLVVMEWDAVIERNDWFEYAGEIYDVVEVMPYNSYEVRALAIRRG